MTLGEPELIYSAAVQGVYEPDPVSDPGYTNDFYPSFIAPYQGHFVLTGWDNYSPMEWDPVGGTLTPWRYASTYYWSGEVHPDGVRLIAGGREFEPNQFTPPEGFANNTYFGDMGDHIGGLQNSTARNPYTGEWWAVTGGSFDSIFRFDANGGFIAQYDLVSTNPSNRSYPRPEYITSLWFTDADTIYALDEPWGVWTGSVAAAGIDPAWSATTPIFPFELVAATPVSTGYVRNEGGLLGWNGRLWWCDWGQTYSPVRDGAIYSCNFDGTDVQQEYTRPSDPGVYHFQPFWLMVHEDALYCVSEWAGEIFRWPIATKKGCTMTLGSRVLAVPVSGGNDWAVCCLGGV